MLETSLSEKVDSLWDACERWVGRAIKVSVGIGTLVTLLYFLRIHYVPLDGVTSIAGLASAVALVSLGFLVVLTGMWGTPTLVFRACAQACPDVVLPLFWRSCNFEDPAEQRAVAPSVKKTLGWTAATIGIPWAGIFMLAWLHDRPEWFGGNTSAFIALGIWMLAIWLLTSRALQRTEEDGAARRKSAAPMLRIARLAFAAGYSLSGSYALLVLWRLATRSYVMLGHDPRQLWIFGLFLTISVLAGVFVNAISIAVALHGEGIAKVATAAQAGVVLISLVVGATAMGVWPYIHDRVMILASVRMPNTHLVLSKTGCQALEIQGFKVAPSQGASAASAATSAADGLCALNGVTLLARIGSRWPIGCESTGELADARTLFVKSDDVLSIVVGSAASAPGVPNSVPVSWACPTPHHPASAIK